jgi:DNA-binding transcriptional ArsR family regulator
MMPVDYAAYLRCEHWLAMRRHALWRADFRCQVCNSTKNLEVHHRTYERLGDERPADLTVLCHRCHRVHHGTKEPEMTETLYRVLRVLNREGSVTSAQMAFIIDASAGAAGQLLSKLRAAGLAERYGKLWKPTREGRKTVMRAAA